MKKKAVYKPCTCHGSGKIKIKTEDGIYVITCTSCRGMGKKIHKRRHKVRK